MKWSELEDIAIDSISRLNCILMGYDFLNNGEQMQAGFFGEDGSIKDIQKVHDNTTALCNYMFEDGSIDITDRLQQIRNLANNIKAESIKNKEHGKLTIACHKVVQTIDLFLSRWHSDNNPEKPTASRGRQNKSFKDLVTNDTDGSKLNKLRNAMKNKKGRNAALIIYVAVESGIITKPTYTQVAEEFGDIGCRSGYNKYYSSHPFTDEEKEGAKKMLQ
jgi:hypothetical protein